MINWAQYRAEKTCVRHSALAGAQTLDDRETDSKKRSR